MASCTEHPERRAEFACAPCQRLACVECVAPRTHACRFCGVRTDALVPTRGARAAPLPQARARVVPEHVEPIERRLGAVVRFVARAKTLLVLAGLAILTTVIRWLTTADQTMSLTPKSSILVWVIVAGMEASVYFHIVVVSAAGHDELEPPEFTSLGESLAGPLIRYLFTLVPLIASLIWFAMSVDDIFLVFGGSRTTIFDYPGPAILFVVSLALWPLMTMIAAIGRSIVATYNPMMWIRMLRATGRDYVVGVVLFYGLLVAETLILDWIAGSRGGFFAALGVAFLFYIAMALRARLLGLICQPHVEA